MWTEEERMEAMRSKGCGGRTGSGLRCPSCSSHLPRTHLRAAGSVHTPARCPIAPPLTFFVASPPVRGDERCLWRGTAPTGPPRERAAIIGTCSRKPAERRQTKDPPPLPAASIHTRKIKVFLRHSELLPSVNI